MLQRNPGSGRVGRPKGPLPQLLGNLPRRRRRPGRQAGAGADRPAAAGAGGQWHSDRRPRRGGGPPAADSDGRRRRRLVVLAAAGPVFHVRRGGHASADPSTGRGQAGAGGRACCGRACSGACTRTGARALADGTPFHLAEVRKSVVFIRRSTPGLPTATGTGFFVTADGLIATNRHVIQAESGPNPATVLYVGVPSAADPDVLDYFRATVAFCPPVQNTLDFALLKIAARPGYQPFRPLPLAPADAKLKLGDPAAAIGFPFASVDKPELSFNKGSISSTRKRDRGPLVLPDRRRGQPRQLGRAAAQRRRPGRRNRLPKAGRRQ